MAKFAGYPGDVTWGESNFLVTTIQKSALDLIWFLLTGQLEVQETGEQSLVIGKYAQDPNSGNITLRLFHRVITIQRNGNIINTGEE